jgi:uncharacterized protein (TIGR03086 family)
MLDPVVLFERAATNAVALAEQVRPEQRHAPTPCTEWDVDALLEHMAAGTGYLLNALGRPRDAGPTYRDAVNQCVDALRQPGALDGRCMSPAGFEWSIGEATAGTAMDQLVHTWDLAVAIGADRRLDPELAETCIEMFVPQMPEVGRAAGFVGAEIPVAGDAPAQDRLLAAMGRRP